MTDLTLASEFLAATREQWRGLVDKVLKGADFEKALVTRSHGGLRIEPLYDQAAGDAPRALRARTGPWGITQRVDHPDGAQANALALADLSGGADGLAIVLPTAASARGFGVQATNVEAFDTALAGVMLDLVHIRLDAGGAGRGAAALLVALAERRGHALGGLDVDLGLDPIGAFAGTGRMSAAWGEVAKRCADTGHALAARGFKGRSFLADGRPYHEAGGSPAQELAATVATGIGYLRALEAHGLGLAAARDMIAFLLVADADQFVTTAKFRAMRRLWARIEDACGLEPKPIRLHAETAWRMTTRRDPWVNILRTTVAAFAAGLGGADTVTVLPLTAAQGLPDAFARRVARNTQLILLEESNLWRVADPAAGAGGFEALTDALAEKAWALFQSIEMAGGIVQSLAQGALQAEIAVVRAERETAIALRKVAITGTSEFPDIHEKPVAVLMRAGDVPAPPVPAPPGPAARRALACPAEGGGAAFAAILAAAADGASLADIATLAPGGGGTTIDPLPSRRDAEPFEALRDASDLLVASTGARPKIFLANLGPIAAFTPRAMFAKNLFEAGGIETVTNDGFATLAALVAAFEGSGAALACLCSSDAIYAGEAADAARALAAAGARHVYLAGRPGDREATFREAGIGSFVFAGCDVLTVLREALKRAG